MQQLSERPPDHTLHAVGSAISVAVPFGADTLTLSDNDAELTVTSAIVAPVILAKCAAAFGVATCNPRASRSSAKTKVLLASKAPPVLY